MIPYGSLLWAAAILWVVVPTIASGLTGRLSARGVLGATVAMAVAQYAGDVDARGLAPLLAVVAYTAFEWSVARTLLWARARTESAWPFRLAVLLGLAPLLLEKLLPALGRHSAPALLGLSYLTFRSLDVIIGVQDRLVRALPAGAFVRFLLFFPTLSAGPIDRYRRFEADLAAPPAPGTYLDHLDTAARYLFRGLLYKFVLGELVSQRLLQPLESRHGFLATTGYMYAYSAFLFFDFAGYSALAIALGALYGVRVPDNFRRPFLAPDIREFWNRWHISLSFWFRDHVYSRFLLAAKRGRWFADRHLPSSLGLLLTMGLMGAWHGLAARYLVYGLYHGVLLVGYERWSRWRGPARGSADGGRLAHAASVALTFQAVCFGLLIFSGRLF